MSRAAFKTMLSILGFLMEKASRHSPIFRSQVTGDVVVEISSGDGVAHHYVFSRTGRSVASRPGPAPEAATVALCFASAGQGLRAFSSPRAVGHVVQALLAGTATIRGNPVLFLWFYGLTRIVIPVGRQRPLSSPLPGALLAPNPASKAAGFVTREPARAKIDPGWTNGIEQHRKLAIVQGSAGEAIPMV
jgi:hypothetical protein